MEKWWKSRKPIHAVCPGSAVCTSFFVDKSFHYSLPNIIFMLDFRYFDSQKIKSTFTFIHSYERNRWCLKNKHNISIKSFPSSSTCPHRCVLVWMCVRKTMDEKGGGKNISPGKVAFVNTGSWRSGERKSFDRSSIGYKVCLIFKFVLQKKKISMASTSDATFSTHHFMFSDGVSLLRVRWFVFIFPLSSGSGRTASHRNALDP